MSKSKGSPRKFSEKIALLNKKEAEGNAEFEKIIKEVEETTRTSPQPPPAPLRQQAPLYYPNPSSSWKDDFQASAVRSPSNSYERPQQQIQHQHQAQQQPPLQAHHLAPINNYHVSLQTPANVPNINIFPIDDESLHQHHQHHHHHHHHHQSAQQQPNHFHQQQVSTSYRNLDCSNQISAARSLPDIANLRVSGSLCSQLGPSYSDRRITQSSGDEHYDYNSHDYSHQFAGSGQLSAFGQDQQQAVGWQCLPQQFEQPLEELARLEAGQQDYCQSGDSLSAEPDASFGQRANSTTGWHNGHHQQGLAVARANLNSNLSKSSEVYTSYSASSPLELQLTDNSADCFSPDNAQLQPEQNYRMRSSSYNSIDHFHATNDLKSIHQPVLAAQMAQQQPVYAENQDYHFYEQ